jgi:hypothetical protein
MTCRHDEKRIDDTKSSVKRSVQRKWKVETEEKEDG